MARAIAVTRLVVLPFRVVPPDHDTDFLAIGLADALTASLSGLDSMVVRSPLAAAGFAGPAPDLKVIATALDVDAVRTATLMRAGDQLRINAQLVEAPAGTVHWSHRSQTGLGDLFALQDELTRQIVESLSVPLSRSDKQALKRDVPASARAYEFYLRANELSRTNETSELARDLYLQCLDEDLGYAPAWARLGRVFRRIGNFGDRARSGEYFEKAHRLDPNVVTSVCHTFWMMGDTRRAVETERPEDQLMGMLAVARDDQTAPVIAQLKRLEAKARGSLLHATRAFRAALE